MTKKQKEPSSLIVIHPDGRYDIETINKLSLERAQELVGGYVQVVPQFTKFEGQPCVVLTNEEGKMRQQPYNNRATLEWLKCAGPHADCLVGDVVVITGPVRKKWG